LEQLENLAQKQVQYKSDPSMSPRNSRQPNNGMDSRSFYGEESEAQIIDVVAKDDGTDIMKDDDESNNGDSLNDFQRGGIEDKEPRTQERIQAASNRDRTGSPDFFSSQKADERGRLNYEYDTEEKDKKRMQLEAQARQRSKQKSIRSEALTPDHNLNSGRRKTTPEAFKEDPVRKQAETSLQIQKRLDDQTGLTRQQKEVAEAIMKTDGSYKPSPETLANTPRMLKEVFGFPLSDYKGSKEFLQKKSNVSVYVGRALSVPVRVTTPGTFVEFSIRKKASEFDLGLLVVPDKGYPIDVKKLVPFTKHSGKGQDLLRDTVLVGAACAPCTLQFKFENKQSTLLEKVVVSYDIKVTSPSKELLAKARELRTESCLRAVEEDLIEMTSASKSTGLEDEVEMLKAQIEMKTKEIDSLKDEERRWSALIATMETSGV